LTATLATAHMSMVQAVVLAALQGFTELFPFSSLGFQVITPHILHWSINTSSNQFLPFIVALHLGTAIGLIVYFARDWGRLIVAFFRSTQHPLTELDKYPEQKAIWLLIAATIPAGIVGYVFQHVVAGLLSLPTLAAVLLIVNGLVMLAGDRLVRHGDEDIPKMAFWQAILIGVAQILALIPGFSRSGMTMVGGLLVGLSYETAARFSFLMATPVILAAGVLELHKLHLHGLLAQSAVGFVVAAVVAYFSVRYLMRYFQTNRLMPLALISMAAGVVFTGLLLAGA
jgi:undecaprenyl-diphosphatase